MTKNREDDAMNSLKWLRGWQTNDTINNEFNDLKRYKEYSNACPVCRKTQVKCTHPPATITQNLQELTKRKSMKPFSVLVICCFFGFTCGTHHLLSFVVQILNTFHSPIDANWATVCFKHSIQPVKGKNGNSPISYHNFFFVTMSHRWWLVS